MKSPALLFLSVLTPALTLMGPGLAHAQALSCRRVLVDQTDGQVVVTDSEATVHDLLKPLTDATESRLRHPFTVQIPTDDPRRPILLPNDANSYRSTKFMIWDEPTEVPAGAKVFRNVEFGYELSGGYREIGTLKYVVVSAEGHVLEVGGASREIITELKYHVLGRVMSARELKVIEEINTKLINELRKNPEAQAKVREFAKKRGWPAGIEEEAQLAYFGDDVIDLRQWAKAHRYSLEQMRDAGWMLLTFTRDGKPNFRTNARNSIKIPYFTDASQSEIAVWRSRMNEARADGKRYIGWQMDRSVDREFDVGESLYNGWKLKEAEGKTLVITEGEFKCMIATKSTGILTLGIQGITQFDAKIAKSVVDAKAKEIIVVLDRDPKGKGLMRVDGITDSQRAAYSIARELQRAGATNVKVGILPNAFDGSKVGIDDLILDQGTAGYMKTLQSAMDPEVYARQIGLDMDVAAAQLRRQVLNKSIESYRRSAQRGGTQVDRTVVKQLQKEADKADRDFRRLLAAKFNGATTINRGAYQFPSLFPDRKPFPDLTTPVAATAKGEPVTRGPFLNDLLIMDYMPADLKSENCKPAPCSRSEMSQADVRQTLTGKGTPEQNAQMQKGLKAAEEAGFAPQTPADWSEVLLAGRLTQDFPIDEYRYEFNMKFGADGSAQSPITIFRRDYGTAVVIARFRTTEQAAAQDGDLFARVSRYLRP